MQALSEIIKPIPHTQQKSINIITPVDSVWEQAKEKVNRLSGNYNAVLIAAYKKDPFLVKVKNLSSADNKIHGKVFTVSIPINNYECILEVQENNTSDIIAAEYVLYNRKELTCYIRNLFIKI